MEQSAPDMASATFSMINSAGELALHLLEVIMAHRYQKSKTGGEPMTLAYPHEEEGFDLQGHVPEPWGWPLFDEMLSFCSCLFLAQYLQDTHGEWKGSSGSSRRENYY